MSKIKSLSVGSGDFFYVRSNSDNFTVIDCNFSEDDAGEINRELRSQLRGNDVCRFVSTHPDEDHFHGIELLDIRFSSENFYCVDNDVKKARDTESFKYYRKLRSGKMKFDLVRNMSRRWFTEGDDERGSAGFQVLWPKTDNGYFLDELSLANSVPDASPNNISPVLRYSIKKGPSFLWAGDLETEFMELVSGDIELHKTTVVFAPHHGRKSGRLPSSWLERLSPDIIVVGEAPSQELEYYRNWNTITQNGAGDILFDCSASHIDIYVSNAFYEVGYLCDLGLAEKDGLRYLGSLMV